MLIVIGDLIADIVVIGAGALERGTDNPADVRLTRGGSAANVAAAAAASGVATRFIGCVGDDPLGDALLADLAAIGVETRVQRGARTGTIVVLVDRDGERTMITDRGAAAELTGIPADWLSDASWLHLPLYGFAEPASRHAVSDAAATVSSRGVPVSIDLSSVATLRALGAERVRGIVAETSPTVVFANQDEHALMRAFGVEVDAVTVVKQGAGPVIVRAGGLTAHVAVDPVDGVVDSTGAGDAFAAGYIAAALAGAAPTAAARRGIARAARALGRAGAL